MVSNFQMSLFSVILNGFQLDPNYQCSGAQDAEKTARRPILGTYFMISGGILMLLYSLCLKVMLSKDLIKSSSYQIMICLAIFDISSLFVNSLVTGIFGYFGLTYCDFSLFIYICGAVGFGCWLGCSMTCVTLAMCRIAEVNPKFKLDMFFKGSPMKVLICWFAAIVAFGTLFTKPVIFRLEYMSWFFDPGVGGDPSLYTNLYHTINNIGMALLTSILYLILCYSIFRKHASAWSPQMTHSQRQFCYQALVICIAHSFSSTCYVYMQFFYTPVWLIAVEQVGWQMCTGGVCLVYLVFNKTIRSSISRTLRLRNIHKSIIEKSSKITYSVSVVAF